MSGDWRRSERVWDSAGWSKSSIRAGRLSGRPDNALIDAASRHGADVARCLGDVGQSVRMIGELKVKNGGPCASPRLRVRFRGSGGEDCDPRATACPDIAYSARRRVAQPRGCG
jgi:hypothetical protein